MSTIAWDGTMLAADTRGVIGESMLIERHKLFRLTEGRTGVCCRWHHE